MSHYEYRTMKMSGLDTTRHGLATILTLLFVAACTGMVSTPYDHVEVVTDATSDEVLAEDVTATLSAPIDPEDVVTDAHFNEDPIEDVAREFRRLRAIEGHFEGGSWNDDVDKWMGRKHQLMIQLDSRLGTGKYSRGEIIELLGPPDLTASEGDDLFKLVGSISGVEKPATGSYEFLIYYWRGTHDFLYFTAQEETIINSGWWYAGE